MSEYNENQIQSNELERITQENERISNEVTRKANDIKRVARENLRVEQELERMENERSRMTEETIRMSSEEIRVENEEQRQSTIAEMESSELERVTRENERISSETTRKTNELEREKRENLRIENEEERIRNESDRINKEDIRESAEEIRVENERTRQVNEAQRIADEAIRAEFYDGFYSRFEHYGVNVMDFGAKGDAVTDDTVAIKACINDAINKNKRTVFIPSGVYKITSSIIINAPIRLIGAGIGETYTPTVILKDGDFDGILVRSRDVVLENFAVKGKQGIDNSDGIIIGDDGYNAQSCVIRNVLAHSNGGNGITLKQCNNGTFDNIVTLYNGGNGFAMDASSECNYSGNIINITNSYGNGESGVVFSGEGNKLYICAQSNGQDNLRLIGWCNNCDITGYTEYAKNGYEINITGNCFANDIRGVYRSTTNKVYNSTTGLPNKLNFTQDLQAGDTTSVTLNDKVMNRQIHFINGVMNTPVESLGYLTYNNGLCFVDNNNKTNKISYTSMEKITFNGDVCHSENGSGGTTLLYDSNGNFDTQYIIMEDGVIETLSVTIKEALTSDILQVFVYKNGISAYEAYVQFNTSNGKNLTKDISISVVKGDVISIYCAWFSAVSPRNNKAKVVLYKK